MIDGLQKRLQSLVRLATGAAVTVKVKGELSSSPCPTYMPPLFPSSLSTRSVLMNSAMPSISTSFSDTLSDLDLDAEATAHARNPTKNAHVTLRDRQRPQWSSTICFAIDLRLQSPGKRSSPLLSQHISQGGCSPQTRFSKGSTHNASLRHLR